MQRTNVTRRQFLKAGAKAGAVLAAGMRPIVCVGETLAEREAGRTLEVVGRQVRGGLSSIPAAALAARERTPRALWCRRSGSDTERRPDVPLARVLRLSVGWQCDKRTC